jgi:hypothetical protein
MDLKNAAAVCLISLFAATLVALIARSLDSQAAARLEPQLARIVEELEAIRKGGGIATATGEWATPQAADDALMVYYFHGVRCPTCRAAESNAHETLQTEYASQLQSGQVVWKVLDYMTDPAAEAMAKDFGVATATIVLVKMKDGQIDASNRLDRTLALAEDKPALAAYLQEEIDEMLKAPDQEPEPAPPTEVPSLLVPESAPEEAPISTGPPDIPIPQ